MRSLSLCRITILCTAAIFALLDCAFAINFTPLNFPGALYTAAHGIDGNRIVGYYGDAAGAQHGFLYDGTTWTTLDVPFSGHYDTRAFGISGETIVGWYLPGPHGFAFDGATWTPLDYPGSTNRSNQAVDGDDIVGLADVGGFHYDAATGTPHGFVATIPEPLCRMLIATAVSLLIPRRRERDLKRTIP